MTNYLLEQLRALTRGNSMSQLAAGQALYQIKGALQSHLPAAGSSINVDLPPPVEY